MRAVIALAILFVFLPLDASAGDRREQLMVVDANDKQVGTVVGSRVTQVTIALAVNGRHVLLEATWAVDSPVFPGVTLLVPPLQGAGSVRFEGPGCSGQPFLTTSANELLDLGAVAPPGMTLYLPAVPRALPTAITWRSSWGSGACRTQEEPVLSDSDVPAVAFVDLLTLFTPPFRVLVRD